jgi:hypothetical protein
MNGNCSLCELNTALLEKLFEFLNIETPVIRASEINPDGAGSPLILDICLKTECKIYLSGISGKDYLVLDDFSRQGIRVDFQEFHHPVYNQMYEPFMPCMSVMDLLFNYGDKSLDVIHGKGVTVMGKLFE